jgi:hypothetical protein
MEHLSEYWRLAVDYLWLFFIWQQVAAKDGASMAGKIFDEQLLEVSGLSAEELAAWRAAKKEAEAAKKKEETAAAADKKANYRFRPYPMGSWAMPQAPPMTAMMGQQAGQLSAMPPMPQLSLMGMGPAAMAVGGGQLGAAAGTGGTAAGQFGQAGQAMGSR